MTTVRISESYQKTLRELARYDGKSMQAIVEQAIESYRRQRFLEGLSQDFKTLQNDTKAWQAELKERKEWDITMSDGEKA
ncbi:MAG: ribbon-helix-helix protein, CopG family [Deltaproteobacteria bacterium]